MDISNISSFDVHAIIYLSNFIAVTNFQAKILQNRITLSNSLWSSIYKQVIRNLNQQIL